MFRRTIAGVAFVALSSASAFGIVRRDDVTDASAKTLGNTFGNTGFVLSGLSGGSGVLISSSWVLTAAHVVDGSPTATVSFASDGLSGALFGNSYNINQVFVNPGWNGTIAGGNDIALLHISSANGSASPLPAPATLYSGNSEIGVQATMVGYGTPGVGSSGFNSGAADFVRRGGTNLISITADQDPFILNDPTAFNGNAVSAAQYLVSDFDDPPAQSQGTDTNNAYYNALDPLAMESSTAPGDSGGPVFASIGGGIQVIAINSFIGAYFDGTDNASYGDIMAGIRVSPFIPWINSVTGLPEPSSLAGLAAGMALLFRRARAK